MWLTLTRRFRHLPQEDWAMPKGGIVGQTRLPDSGRASRRRKTERSSWSQRLRNDQGAGGTVGMVSFGGRAGEPWLLRQHILNGPFCVITAEMTENERRMAEAWILDHATAAGWLSCPRASPEGGGFGNPCHFLTARLTGSSTNK